MLQNELNEAIPLVDFNTILKEKQDLENSHNSLKGIDFWKTEIMIIFSLSYFSNFSLESSAQEISVLKSNLEKIMSRMKQSEIERSSNFTQTTALELERDT